MKENPLNRPWFETAFFEELLESSDISAEEKKLVTDFARDGYVIIDTLVDDINEVGDNLIKNLSDKYDNQKYAPSWETRIQDAWNFEPLVKEIALSQKIMKLLEVLYQRKPVPFQTLNFCAGTEQRTHVDAIHFNSIPHGYMCGVWVALEDIDEKNGPLHYIPGSHKIPFHDLHDVGLSGTDSNNFKEAGPYYCQYLDMMDRLCEMRKLKKEKINVKKGQALVWSANLMHGGDSIIDKSRTRHSQVTHYYFSECMYYTPLHSDPYLGKYFWRNITDISTGHEVVQYYNGKKLK